MFRFSIRDLLFLTLIVGLAVGWWVDRRRQDSAYADKVKQLEDLVNARPYKVESFYANGQVSMDFWERRTPSGETERLWDLGSTYFYSNGVKAAKYYSGDTSLTRHYSPKGTPISWEDSHDFYFRDMGDGTFAKSFPHVVGRPSRLAKEYPVRPKLPPPANMNP
jgi:hypothetical protein